MNIIFNILVLVAGFVLGFTVFQSKDQKESVAEKTPSIDEGPKPNNIINGKYDTPMQSDPDILEKKMLYDEELSLLLKVGEELSSGIRLNQVCKIIVDNVKKILNVERCALLLIDPETKKLHIEYSVGLSDEEARSTEIKKSESISGWTAANNEILFVKNIESDHWIKMMNQETYYKGSLVSIPLSVRGKVLGILNINNRLSGSQFSDDDLRLLKGIASQSAAAIQNAELYKELEEGYLRTITALAAAIDAKDHYTRRHSENVTRYATAIAKELNLTNFEIESVRRSGLLHDIGKIGISDDILLCPRNLTDEEYEKIKEHSVKGEEIINSLPFLKEVASYVRHHHERFDGAGYPDGKKAKEIELIARILAVSDTFDAMTSDRPYRKARSIKEATEELKKCSGSQFDPEVVDAFLKVLEQNPKIVKEES